MRVGTLFASSGGGGTREEGSVLLTSGDKHSRAQAH